MAEIGAQMCAILVLYVRYMYCMCAICVLYVLYVRLLMDAVYVHYMDVIRCY